MLKNETDIINGNSLEHNTILHDKKDIEFNNINSSQKVVESSKHQNRNM